MNANGTLDLASSDRITESDTAYTQDSGAWWQVSTSKIYPDTDSATPKTTGISKRKLTDLGGLRAVASVIDHLGNETLTTTAVDRDARKITQTTDVPDSISNIVQVSVNGLLRSSTSKSGHKTTFGYDALQRQITVTDPRIGPSLTHFNDKGQVDWTQDPAGNRTSYAYDPDSGRPFSKTDPFTNTIYTTYTLYGEVEKTWGATYPVRYEFDTYNRQIKMHTYRGPAAPEPPGEGGWDGPEWPTDTGDSDETTWNYEESTGFLLSKADDTGNAVTYTYTPDGKTLTRTWARTVAGAPLVTTYTHSPAGNLVAIDYSDNTPDVTYTHDRLGRQLTAGSSVSEHAFTYNANLQLESEIISSQSSGTNVFTHSFDLLGRSTGFSLTDNRTPVTNYQISYSHDPFGRFSSISSSVNSAFSVVNYSYLPSSDILAGFSNSLAGLYVSRAYEDHRNLITEIHNQANGTTISQFIYTNDALGRRVGRQDSGLAFVQAVPNAFGYNTRSELTTAAMGTNAFGYAYDPIGNRQAATNNGESLAYTANSLNQYTQIADGFTNAICYDLDGNLTNDGRWANTWDAENRLIGVEPVTLTNGAHKVEFTYDFMSRRVQKQVWTWEYDAWSLTEIRRNRFSGWSLISETVADQQSTRTNHYVCGLDLSGTLSGAGGVGGLVAATFGTNSVAYTMDGNGNVSELLGPDSSIQAHYEYSGFGETIVRTGPLAEANVFRFSTKPIEPITGLILYEYRPYVTSWGRWISNDLIGERGFVIARLASTAVPKTMSISFPGVGAFDARSLSISFLIGNSKERNLNVFVLNNPVKFFDAMGLMAGMTAPKPVIVVIFVTRTDTGAAVQTADTLRVLGRMTQNLEWGLIGGALPSGASIGEQSSKIYGGKCYRHVYFVDAQLSNNFGEPWPYGHGEDFSCVVYAERTKAKFDRDDIAGGMDIAISSRGRNNVYFQLGGFMLAHEILHSVGANHKKGNDRFVMSEVPSWDWILRWPFVSQQTVDEVKKALDVRP